MDPLKGSAEQISASTIAVIVIKMMVITYEDLLYQWTTASYQSQQNVYHMAAGPPESSPTNKTDLFSLRRNTIGKLLAYLTPPMKLRAEKLAAKFSMRCQVRCNC